MSVAIESFFSKTPSYDPDFYRDNTFLVDYPSPILTQLRKLPSSCLTAIRKIHVFIHAVYNPGPELGFLSSQPPDGPQWVELFEYLAANATGLRTVRVYLDAEGSMGHWGGGNDNNLLQALGKLQTLDVFELDGYFAKDWPSYLREKITCEVRTTGEREDGYSRDLASFQKATSWS